MRRQKALLVCPNGMYPKNDHIIKRVWTPLCLLNCAALLEKNGWTVEIIDLRLSKNSHERLKEKAKNCNLIIIATNPLDRWQCPTLEIEGYYKVCKSLKRNAPEKKVITIGPHTLFDPHKFLDFSDVVVIGEPEQKIMKLHPKGMEAFLKEPGVLSKAKTSRRIRDAPPFSFESLPPLNFGMLECKKYYDFMFGGSVALIETSRGCPGKCVFCLKSMYGNKIRFKPIKNIIDELKSVQSQGIKNVYFFDLNFIINPIRAKKLCKEIIKHGIRINWCCEMRVDCIEERLLELMKASGCCLVYVGIESGSKKIIKSINKDIGIEDVKKKIILVREKGIKVAGYFRFGNLGETKKDILQTIDFARSLPLDFASFEKMVPYPKTPFSESSNQGLKTFSEEGIPLAYEGELSIGELNGLIRSAYCRFYLRPGYIFKHLPLIKNTKMIIRALTFFKSKL